MVGEGLQASAIAHSPEFDGASPRATAGGQRLPIRREGHGGHHHRLPVKVCRQAPSLTRQSLNGFIPAAGGQRLPIRREGHGIHSLLCPVRVCRQAPSRHAPEFDGVIITAGGQRLPIRRESHGVHRIRMSGEGLQADAIARTPELDSESSLPEASVCPSGVKATAFTELQCPEIVCKQAPSRTRQHLMRELPGSAQPETSVCPSGVNATEATSAHPARRLRYSPLWHVR